MIPKIIKTEEEYQKYLDYIESVFQKELSEEESNNVEVISALIEIYENSKKINVDEENFDDINIDYIYNLVNLVSPIERSDITKKGLKLNEEVGELSAEILKLVNYKYHNDTPQQIRYNLLQESVDSLIMIFDILVSQNYSKEEVITTSEEKIEKWLNQINNK